MLYPFSVPLFCFPVPLFAGSGSPQNDNLSTQLVGSLTIRNELASTQRVENPSIKARQRSQRYTRELRTRSEKNKMWTKVRAELKSPTAKGTARLAVFGVAVSRRPRSMAVQRIMYFGKYPWQT